MPRPFNSASFLADPFFTQPAEGDGGVVVITRLDSSSNPAGASATIPCIYRHGLDPQRDGALIQRGGHWADCTVLATDYFAAFGAGVEPQIHEQWVLDGEAFTVEAHSKDGDVFTVKALSKQRRNR